MESDTLTIRIPADLKKRLAAAAKADDRSVTSYVVRAVKRSIALDEWVIRAERDAIRNTIDDAVRLKFEDKPQKSACR